MKAFANAEQQIGRFKSVFKDLSGDAEEFATILARGRKPIGFRTQRRVGHVSIGPLGCRFRAQDALDMSKALTEMTQDLLAFDDSIKDPQEALDRILSGLSGMVIPVQRFGADIRVASIEQALLAAGINKTNQQLTLQQREMLRLQIMAGPSGDPVPSAGPTRSQHALGSTPRGSGGRSSGSIAIGEALAPAAQLSIRAFTATARAISDYVKANAGVAVGTAAALVGLTAIAAATTVLGVVAITASPTFEYWRPWPVLLRRRFWRWQPRLRPPPRALVFWCWPHGVLLRRSQAPRAVGRSNDRHDDGPWANGPSVGRDGDRRRQKRFRRRCEWHFWFDPVFSGSRRGVVFGRARRWQIGHLLGRAFVALSAQIGRTLVVATAMFVCANDPSGQSVGVSNRPGVGLLGRVSGRRTHRRRVAH